MKVKRWTHYDHMEDDNGMYVLAEDYDRLLDNAKRLYDSVWATHLAHEIKVESIPSQPSHDPKKCKMCKALADFRKRWGEDA